MAMVWAWTEFFACMLAILLAGLRLTHYGQLWAELSGLSRGWIGLVLVATVTSLPELVTGVGAVTLVDAPDLAVGNALGSCVFNLAMVGLVQLLDRRAGLMARADLGHGLAACYGLMMLAWVALALWLSDRGLMPAWGPLSLASGVLVLLYALALRGCYRARPQADADAAEAAVASASVGAPARMHAIVVGYLLSSLVIVGAGLWLPQVGLRVAQWMGWSNSLVGTVLMASATTAPELAATLGALRLGAIDMVLGNLLGSNLFDLLILAIDDMAYLRGPLYEGRSPQHLLTLLAALGMTAVVGWGMRVGSPSRWPGAVLLLMAAGHLALQVRLGA